MEVTAKPTPFLQISQALSTTLSSGEQGLEQITAQGGSASLAALQRPRFCKLFINHLLFGLSKLALLC